MTPPPPSLAPLMAGGRAERLLAAADGFDALVVTDPTDVRWLTGFGGSNGRVAVTPRGIVLVTDARYRERAAAEIGAAGVDAEIVVAPTREQQVDALVAALTTATVVGAPAASMRHSEWEELAAALPLRAADTVFAGARRVKDAAELARITAAARCADAALADVAPMFAGGVTEADVRDELEYRMRRFGADGAAYDTIVASGPDHAARPHHETGRRRIVEGDLVIIDVGARVDGYRSDMTRTFVVGEPTAEQEERYALVLRIQRIGLDAVIAGAAARDVDAACRAAADEAGLADDYLHSTGHGVGLLIHEEPFLAPTSSATLLAGEVVTVEPGLYRVGFGGVRVEDLVEVTSDGARVLTTFPKDTPCLPSRPTT